MVERINLLLKAKNITARQFAEEIGIQPSGMSHILSGRNNPSLDFVMKVVRRWPEVNISWLMFGQGEMYAGVPLNVPEPVSHESVPQSAMHESEQYDLFAAQEPPIAQPVSEPLNVRGTTPKLRSEPPAEILRPAEPQAASPVAAPQPQPAAPLREVPIAVPPQPAENVVETPIVPPAAVQPTQKRKKVVKMIVMYDDHSFAEYYPE